MYSENSTHDVIRCDLCERPFPSMHCDTCQINLCKGCVVDHFSDESKDHKVVSLNKRGSSFKFPKCQTHSPKICELHCRHCHIPICVSCISSGDHDNHQKVDILKIVKIKKELIEKDMKYLEKTVYPKYKEAILKLQVQKAHVRKHSEKLTIALDKQREALHTEINNIIQEMNSEIEDVDAQQVADIDQQEDAINHTINEITQAMLDLQKLLDSDDICIVSEYTSKTEEFKNLPDQFQVTLPTFTPMEINKEQIRQQIGSLSRTIMITSRNVFSPPARPLIDVPRILTDIQTRYGELRSVSCLSDNELWTCGDYDKTMRLYNLQGELLKSVETKSGHVPRDIAVTRKGDLVYTDYDDSSINLVSGTQIHTLIKLRGWFVRKWRPHDVCSTSSGNLLVIMTSDDGKLTKVVRYSGSTEKQTIQWEDKGKPLYESGGYLSENRNLDICVADNRAHAVVVVSTVGKLRF
uniref:Uncharacterized protein LOC111123846 n=1 Tax=Crassostrea virginica TaxID=6565 RepID=A0A8B8D210_CRAVI|nr:uncharacterized protein LOC111123846 [Crassostrea virginica]